VSALASLAQKRATLEQILLELGSLVVAYSGGVDSACLAVFAHRVLGAGALAVTADSESLSGEQRETALDVARRFDFAHRVVRTSEMANPLYVRNQADRCYHCKGELYRELERVAREAGAAAILDGTIADDLGDWRPGHRAAGERGVRSPLAELGFVKADVRAVAAHYGIASAEKPASPCLASRIPYGTEITRENLAMVEGAEELLRSLGFGELRVRHHGDVARIEVPVADLPRLLDPELRRTVVEGLKALGYRYVALDLEGFRTGSLNVGLPGGTRIGRRPDRRPARTPGSGS